ncbi:MAG: ATP-binding protein [Bacteroidaceae bacterium]|nr:ATP-binding protein [Bacteroidaceae bacterium]
METQKRKNPWLGLQSYREGEVLYGRDDDIRNLTQCVVNDVDTLLYGKSGIGKSSILNAGILPAARRHGYLPIVVRLSHKEPQSYLSQIRMSIGEERLHEVIACKDVERESLYEFFHRHTFHDGSGERIKLLIIFDQFEEIFTLQDEPSRRKRFFRELADLLNDIVPTYLQTEVVEPATGSNEMQLVDTNSMDDLFSSFDFSGSHDIPEYVEDNDIHFVFTIREDFLSEFEYHTAAIPSLKQNRYNLRPINEEQAAQIIMRPIPGLISKSVAKLILEKVTGHTDFELDGVPELEVDSAVLSLYLNRLYDANPSDVITSDLVEQKGGEIISDFYSDAIADLPDETVEYLEDKLLNGQGRRDSVTVFDAEHSGCMPAQVIRELCDNKKILRQFNYGGDLRIELIHDILCPVVKAHRDRREQLRQQEEEHRRQEEEKERMEAERRELIMQQQRERRRFRRILLWTAAAVVVGLAAFLFNAYWNQWEYSEYYASFTRQNGWPVGVGPQLDEQARGQRTVFYRLVRNGRSSKRPFSIVEVCSSTDVVQPNFRSPLVGNMEGGDIKAGEFAALNMKVRSIRFFAENDASDAAVSRELYYDSSDQLLYAVNYYHSVEQSALVQESGDNTFIWAVYVDRNGLPLRVRDNGADRMKVFLSSSDNPALNRLEAKYMFYDEHGSPQYNDIGCYGFRIAYNADRTLDSIFHLDPFSMESMVEVRAYKDNDLTCTYYSLSGSKRMTAHQQLGHARRVETFDSHGNVIRRSFYGIDGKPVQGSAPYASEQYHYDAMNRLDSTDCFNASGQRCAYISYRYNGAENTFSEMRSYTIQDKDVSLAYARVRRTVGLRTDNIDDDRRNGTYRHEIIERDTVHHTIVYSYFNVEGEPVFDSIQQCSRYTEISTSKGEGTVRVKRYYDTDGTLYRNPLDPRVPAIDSAYYDSEGLRRSQVNFDADGKVITSMGYDYKDGVEITRYVLSLDGKTPIRCPQWETDGLCYYRLNNVKNAQTDFNLAYIQAVSEYEGCPSYAYFPGQTDTLHYDFNPVQTLMGENWMLRIQTSVHIPPVDANEYTVQYLHITSLDGFAYQAGLRDGDLVVEQQKTANEQFLTVIRYDRIRHSWQRLQPVRLPLTDAEMEIYPVVYTEQEYSQYLIGKETL